MARFHSSVSVLVIGAFALVCAPAFGAQVDGAAELVRARAEAAKAFKEQVSPAIKNYCGRCHTGCHQKGGVTFESALHDPNGSAFRLLWKRAAAQIVTHDMPPEDEDKQPSDQERKVMIDWIAGMKRLTPKDPGPFIIRRLNKTEYGNTLHDLFGVDPGIARDLPDEVLGAGYTNTLSPLLIEQYLSVANEVLDRSFAPAGAPPTAVQRRLLGELPKAGEDPDAAARQVAKSLTRLAYRRPASDAEIDVLMRVFALVAEKGKPYPEALRLMVKAVLVSPQFLFITPDDAAGNSSLADDAKAEGGIVALDDYQLASRLSYLLWATMPDAELSALADAGKLHEPDVLAAQARRLLADPRSRALFDGFGAQWLGLDKLAGKSFDTEKFPQMTPAMRSAMYDEGRLFFESVLHENHSLTSFIDGDYTFLNSTLAPVYGLEDEVHGDEMRRVKLNNPNRGGILTMPGVLATSSFPNRTSAVNRGVWVLEQVLGEHVPPPPPNVPALDKQDQRKVANLTLRQRTEMHRSNPVCANCHKVLDPIGFGLENFDAIGRWRDKDDSGGKIDATGELPGGHSFSTPKELRRIIAARKDDFCHNLTGKLLAYALCHQLEGYDEIVVDQLADAVAKDDYHMRTLVVGVVTSYPFTHRRITNPGEARPMRSNLHISRRTCLRGLGVALALPLLETMGWADEAKGAAYKPPVRLGFMYMPHGVIPERFWPTNPADFLTSPPPILEPLRPVLDQCLVVKGINGVPISPLNGAPHALELSTWLTATLPDTHKRDVVNIAISADQIAANYVGAFTPLPSLELATMPQTHMEHQEGLNEAYYSHCSFRGPTQPVPAEINPRSVLKRLFQCRETGGGPSGKAAGDALDRSMLDLVLGGAKDLRGKLSYADQHKLDEYLDSVRSVERRIAAIQARQTGAAQARAGVATTNRALADIVPIEVKIPEGDKRSEYMRVMCDLNVLAFQCDLTRVSTYIGSTPNGVSYPELGFTDEHHSQTHHNNDPKKLDKVTKIDAFNVAQFAYMIQKMQSLREGEGTLLDNCIMMWGSGLEDGNKHSREHLPFVIAGKGGGTLKTGRFLPDVKGNQGDLLGTLLTCAGIPLDRPLGIATKQLPELVAT